jgi:predicted nucleic acid-binding protein
LPAAAKRARQRCKKKVKEYGIREMYGALVGKLKITPNEVRNMTLGEAYALIDAMASSDDKQELYELGKAKGLFNGNDS